MEQDAVAAVFERLCSENTDHTLTELIACEAIVAMRDMPAQHSFNDRLQHAVFTFYTHFSGPHASKNANRALAILAELVQQRQLV